MGLRFSYLYLLDEVSSLCRCAIVAGFLLFALTSIFRQWIPGHDGSLGGAATVWFIKQLCKLQYFNHEDDDD